MESSELKKLYIIMTFLQLCASRYSCRAYKQEAIAKEKLDYVMECARLSPSACNKQPWHLRLVTSPENLASIHQCYNREWIRTAPAVVVVSAFKDEAWTRPQDGKCHSNVDAAIIAEHICLAAAEQGLGTCWFCNFDAPLCHELLGMKDSEEPVALIPIGIPADTAPAKKRKALDEILTIC